MKVELYRKVENLDGKHPYSLKVSERLEPWEAKAYKNGKKMFSWQLNWCLRGLD